MAQSAGQLAAEQVQLSCCAARQWQLAVAGLIGQALDAVGK